ncbi:cyclohexanecarboxylate-CoA ligase [Tistrella bauzanensis]|uniref:Cyclohexanecarboxylate-CoA ligase n=1 Tax=Tistrella bauzanensis TaxID=657419 RepID=A0ABQ1ILT9_9PROT|nr:AMP-binding protein [Tistrella bauzanensis]GGB44447.1 cyclohexanecarboxylate-CoA ligase [Tistrella bauzanensis]
MSAMSPPTATLIDDPSGFRLRFTADETARRRASGDWTGRTLADDARHRAATTPDAIACVTETGGLSFGQIWNRAVRLARRMRAHGLTPGAVVSFQLPNWDEAVVLNLACSLAGLVINPIVPIYRDREVGFILNDACSRLLILPARWRNFDYAAMAAALKPGLPSLDRIITVRGTADGCDSWDDWTGGPPRDDGGDDDRVVTDLAPDLVGADASSLKMVMYTSGTTGRPKGVLYAHETSRRALMSSMRAWNIRAGDVLLMPSPVTHVTGYSYGMELPFYHATRTVFMERWDGAQALDLIADHDVAFMIGATPFLQELTAAAEAARAAGRPPVATSLKIFACGGAAVPPEVVRRARKAMPGLAAFRVYGSSECPMITQGYPGTDPASAEAAATSDGAVYDWEVRVVDEAGQPVPTGAEGEIVARGPALFRGYTDPAATAEAFDADGYFRTGDLGTVAEDGRLVITGRKKDLIIRGGENLSAKEIEDALHEHPLVREAAVVAMPHARLGEGVCAWLIPTDAARDATHDGQMLPDRDMIADFVASRGLARQKLPERIEWVDDFPRTASGKIQKHIIRKLVTEQQGGQAVIK